MLLSIITLNYKKPQLTINCIASLYEHFHKEFANDTIELIVIDNNSGDNSVKILEETVERKKYRNVHVFANNENAGFGKGCNSGATKAKGKYLLFLNNDTLVQDAGILRMVEYLEKHSDIAIMGGQLRNSDGTLQPSTGEFYTPSNVFFFLLGMQRFGLLDKSPKRIQEVAWVKGGLFMIRHSVFDKLGGFDENIFMYIEDMELCYRAHKASYRVAFYPNIAVIHEEHGSGDRTFAIVQIYKNLLYFYKKHRSAIEYRFVKFLLKTKATLLLFFGRIVHNSYLTSTYEQALKVI